MRDWRPPRAVGWLARAAVPGLRRVQAQVAAYATAWDDANTAALAAEGPLWVALGDSTAQGIGASGPERGYVGLVARRLRTSSGRPVQVLNFSRTGARLRDVVAEQLPRLAGLSPDVVTVAVGANDIKDYDAARFRADVDALVAGLPRQAVVGDIPWFMHGGTGRKSGEAAAYVDARAAEAHHEVARLHRAMRARGWRAMLTDFAADWFHPNDRGHRLWAGTFWEAIERVGVYRPAM